jgi:hypothetical protein
MAQIQYHDVTPPETPLWLESKVVSIVENERTGKHKVTPLHGSHSQTLNGGVAALIAMLPAAFHH